MLLLAYTLRNMVVRARSVVPTMIVIATATGAITALLAIRTGLIRSVEQSGAPDNAIILSRGATQATRSQLPLSIFQQARVSPEVASVDNVELVSPERVESFLFTRKSGSVAPVTVRGIDAAGLRVHPGVQIVGEFPARGAPGVVIGKGLVGKFAGFEQGGAIPIGRRSWPVVGVLVARGTRFESEIWCDRTALMNEMRITDISVVSATLRPDPAALERFAAAFARPQETDVLSERGYYQRSLADFSKYIRVLDLLILILAIGGVLGGSSAMHGSFMSRLQELATLMTIGYTRTRIVISVLQEGLILSLVSGIVGLIGASSIHGAEFSYSEQGLAYVAQVSIDVLLLGSGIAVAIGTLASMVSVAQAYRIDPLKVITRG